jgi:hypothetical protein
MQRSFFISPAYTIHFRSPVQQQAAHIQMSIIGCFMQSVVPININPLYISAALQQHPHHLHMTFLSSKY